MRNFGATVIKELLYFKIFLFSVSPFLYVAHFIYEMLFVIMQKCWNWKRRKDYEQYKDVWENLLVTAVESRNSRLQLLRCYVRPVALPGLEFHFQISTYAT